MKTILVPLIGDPKETLYQLGLKEKESYKKLEKRVTGLLSTNLLLREGQNLWSLSKVLLKKKTPSFFDECIKSYAEGLGIDPARYMNFLSLFELAAHYGQVYPELKGMLPGCSSIFMKTNEEITHSRLFDFPLVNLFEATPRLYYWQIEGKPTLLSYSCEGMAPLFFQAIHGQGLSFALHHKPGLNFHDEGTSIFEIVFETLLETSSIQDFKKQLRKCSSVTKWSFLLLNNRGVALVLDLDGPALNFESYDLNETSPLIFTNIPLQNDIISHSYYIRFSNDRQQCLKEKFEKKLTQHILDTMTNIENYKGRKWIHPAATLSTVGAYHVNLTKGFIDLKEGEHALVPSDRIIRFSLANQQDIKIIKEISNLSEFEIAWKKASKAQGLFDQGEYEMAYHELQMSEALMPDKIWKEILSFYLIVWEYKFISNSKELSLIYKRLKNLKLPALLKDQWAMMCLRFEKKLDLVITIEAEDLSAPSRKFYDQERNAPKSLFLAWMKLLYPRLEILDVFSPHHK